jgi:glutamate synthase domain-containing protein 3
MIEGFNYIQNNVKDMKKNINIKIKDVNDNTIEVRYKKNKNTFNEIKNITGLNNLYLQ